MKSIISIFKYILIITFTLQHCSCVSAIIDSSTNKHRNILTKKNSRIEIRKKVGKPISSWERKNDKKPLYPAYGSSAYDVFEVHGVVARPGDGSAQATTSAVTLGAGEAILLPFTLARVISKPFKVQKLVVFYDRNTYYQKHLIFDKKGNKIDTLGY